MIGSDDEVRHIYMIYDCCLTTSIQLILSDESQGSPSCDIGWDDVREDDYLLTELMVSRILISDDLWDLRFTIVSATRVATTP